MTDTAAASHTASRASEGDNAAASDDAKAGWLRHGRGNRATVDKVVDLAGKNHEVRTELDGDEIDPRELEAVRLAAGAGGGPAGMTHWPLREPEAG